MHIKDFLKQNETPRRKRPKSTAIPSFKDPIEETKDLVVLWKSVVSGMSYFSTPRMDLKGKPFALIHEQFHLLKEKGYSVAQYKPIFEGLVHTAKNPIGTIFLAKHYKSGQGKISLHHLFVSKYKEKSGMPLSWWGIPGTAIELALKNKDALLDTLKYANSAPASHIVSATEVEKSHMQKLGFIQNPELEGKLGQAYSAIWNVISDIDDYDIKPDSKEKALASFYRNFYDWSVDSLVRLHPESIFINHIGQVSSDKLRSDHDFACSMLLLLYLEGALAAKFGKENLPAVQLTDMTSPTIKEKLTALVCFRGNIFGKN